MCSALHVGRRKFRIQSRRSGREVDREHAVFQCSAIVELLGQQSVRQINLSLYVTQPIVTFIVGIMRWFWCLVINDIWIFGIRAFDWYHFFQIPTSDRFHRWSLPGLPINSPSALFVNNKVANCVFVAVKMFEICHSWTSAHNYQQ